MPTLFSSIYTKANILFEDTKLLADLTDDEYSELLGLFLSKAKSIYFKSCLKDLNDVDIILKQFNSTLSEEEEWILATGIRLVWLERQLYKEEKLRDRIGTKDYNIHSPSNLIGKLTELINMTKTDLRSLVVDYTFNSFKGFN